MTIKRGVGVRNVGAVGTTPLEHRLAIAGLVAETSPGVPRSGLLAQTDLSLVKGTVSTAPMSYDIGPFQGVINRAAQDGAYTITGVGTTNVTTDPAPGAGSRYDLIWIKQNDTEKGDPDNSATWGVVKGLASTTPTEPTASVPAGAYVLASARVYAGATATNSASVTITQKWVHTWARQAPPQVAEFVSGVVNIPANTLYGPGTFTADAAASINGGFAVPDVADCIQLLEDGLYEFFVYALSSDTATKPGWLALRNKADTKVYTEHPVASVGTGGGADLSTKVWLPAGTIVRPRFYFTAAWPNVTTRFRIVKDK